MKRTSIFLFFDPRGLVDDYIVECLTSLCEYLGEILVISNSPLDDTARERLLKGATDVSERENTGFGVGGYRDGIARSGWDRLGRIDELVLFNYAFFTPANPWKNLFDRVEVTGAVDFWDITEHDEVRSHPFLAATCMSCYIQSHWIAVCSPLLSSPDFRKYWDEMSLIRSCSDSIRWHESRFMEYFGNLGYAHAVVYPREGYPLYNPVFDNVSMLLANGYPILKCCNLFHDPLYLDRHAIIGADMLELANRAGCDTDLILMNPARTSRPRDLVTNASLTTIISPRADQVTLGAAASLKVLVVAYVFYADVTDEILNYLSILPAGYRLAATTSNEENKTLIKVHAQERGVDVDVRVVSSNRGRDIGAFLVGYNDVLTPDEYDIVVKTHSKKSVQDDYNAAQLFKEHLHDSLLASSDHVASILAKSAAHPSLGTVIAPMPHIGYPTMGHAWLANRAPVRNFAKRVGITVPLSDHQPLAPYGSMSIACPEALSLLTGTGLVPEDFPEEGGYKGGFPMHVIERLLSYAVLSRGYYVHPVTTPKWAGVYYGYLEYRLAATSSMMPAFAIGQVSFLKARMGAVPNLLGAIKTSIMVHTPGLGNALKSAYRAARSAVHKIRSMKGER